MITVGEYMTENVITVSPKDTVFHARNVMLRYDIGRLVVVENETLLGVLTLTDIMYALNMPEYYYKPAIDILVKDIMTPNPITVTRDTLVKEACRLMLKYNIGGLPVIDKEGALEGIFTRTDAIRAYQENAHGLHRAGESMDKDPPKVSPYSSLRKVVEVMEQRPYMKVLVVEGERLLGIITKKDLTFVQLPVRALDKPYIKRDAVLMKGRTGGPRYYIVPIAIDIMTKDPITGHPDDDLSELARTMLDKRIGSIPITGISDEVLGLVAKHHILERLVASKF